MDYEMEEFTGELFRVAGLRVTGFSLFVTVGAVIGLVMALRRSKKTGVAADAVLWFAMLGIPLGLLCARLVFVLYNFSDIKYYGFWYIFRMDCGGFTVMGASLGLLLAGWLAKKITFTRFTDLMDTVLPGLLLALAMERFGEGATSNGTGLEVSARALQFFPLARPGIYEGMYTYAVHMFEGMTALVAGVYTQGMTAPRGRAAGTGLILAAAGQIVWESIRKDDRMMFDMASLLMIFCAAVLFILLLLCLIRLDWPLGGKAIAMAGFLLLAAATGALQFFMEGKFVQAIPVWLCFALSCVTTAGIVWLCLRVLAAATED
ncbi:MAG: prolipoprotein diacylglyceryl transferase [Clostridia bacterium]|nr:prolipoprotein diacylglyceryl transferase [Clostridia bacterium]